MTIDEAISEFKERAEDSKKISELGLKSYIPKGKEEEQLAEWLEELKAYRQQHIALCEKYDVNTVEELYVKGIDDFVSRLETVSFTKTQWDLIKIIAEQLKESEAE